MEHPQYEQHQPAMSSFPWHRYVFTVGTGDSGRSAQLADSTITKSSAERYPKVVTIHPMVLVTRE